MLTHASASGVDLCIPCLPVPPQPNSERRKRILGALGLPGKRRTLGVDEQTLARFYDYLVARLELPFYAYYPPPPSGKPLRRRPLRSDRASRSADGPLRRNRRPLLPHAKREIPG